MVIHVYPPIICVYYWVYATNNVSRATHDVMVKKLVIDFATVSSDLKTFSTQVSTSLVAPKQEFPNVSSAPTASTAPSNWSGDSQTSGSTFIHPLLPQLDRANYPNIRDWEPDHYNSRRGRQRGGKDSREDRPASVLSSYMEDETGDQVSEKTKRAVRMMAKGFFLGLLRDNKAPACWGSAPLSVRNQLINTLENVFPFLRFCAGHWKANQVATNSYSQWYGNVVENRSDLKAKKACKSEVIDVDADKNGVGEASKRPRDEGVGVPEPSKRPRVEHPQTTSTSCPRHTSGNPQGQKVCKLIISIICALKPLKQSLLYSFFDYTLEGAVH